LEMRNRFFSKLDFLPRSNLFGSIPRQLAAGRFILIFAVAFLLAVTESGLAQERVKFPVSASSKTLGYSPLWVAQKQGFFDRNALDVQLVLVSGADKAMMALVGGSVYVSTGGADTVLAAAEQGVDVATIGGIINGLTHYIIGGKKFRNYEDLRGATIGSSGLTSGTAFVLRRVLQAKGLEYPRDYQLINVGGSPQAFLSLTSGRIDAAIIAVPLSFEAAEMGYNVIGRVVEVIPNYQLTDITVKKSWAEKNRPLVVRFMKAMVQSMRWLYDKKEQAIDFLSKEMKLKPEHARKGWEYYTENRIWNPNAEANIEGMKTVIQIYAERTQQKGPLPSPTKYVDHSYAEEALRDLGKR
jgi:ABC-type nitrate/sulfonate/bicarbonate transport system substrate-binding protein